MENQTSSQKIIINYGLMLAGASILLGLIQYATGTHLEQNLINGILGFGIFIIFIILGIRKFKANNNQFMSWEQGLKIGVGIAVLAGLIGAIYQYIFVTFIEPDMMNQMLEIQNQKMIDQGKTEEEIEAANEMSKKFQTPILIAAFGIIASAIGGFIISAITSAIMKKTEEDTY